MQFLKHGCRLQSTIRYGVAQHKTLFSVCSTKTDIECRKYTMVYCNSINVTSIRIATINDEFINWKECPALIKPNDRKYFPKNLSVTFATNSWKFSFGCPSNATYCHKHVDTLLNMLQLFQAHTQTNTHTHTHTQTSHHLFMAASCSLKYLALAWDICRIQTFIAWLFAFNMRYLLLNSMTKNCTPLIHTSYHQSGSFSSIQFIFCHISHFYFLTLFSISAPEIRRNLFLFISKWSFLLSHNPYKIGVIVVVVAAELVGN